MARAAARSSSSGSSATRAAAAAAGRAAVMGLLSPAEQGQQLQDNTCGICFEQVPSGERGVIACGHTFCFACIQRWCSATNVCPVCKVRIRRIDREEDVSSQQGASTASGSAPPTTAPSGAAASAGVRRLPVLIRDDRDRVIDEEEEREILDANHWISDSDVRCVGDERCKWR